MDLQNCLYWPFIRLELIVYLDSVIEEYNCVVKSHVVPFRLTKPQHDFLLFKNSTINFMANLQCFTRVVQLLRGRNNYGTYFLLLYLNMIFFYFDTLPKSVMPMKSLKCNDIYLCPIYLHTPFLLCVLKTDKGQDTGLVNNEGQLKVQSCSW